MSYTTIYKVPKSGELEVIAEIQNAYRGAMTVWVELYKRYLLSPDAFYMDEMIGGAVMSNPQPIWDLWKAPRLPEKDKIVLMSTFDHVMVKKYRLPRLIDAFNQWNVPDRGSIPDQAMALIPLLSDHSCFAVCWRQTSVTDTWSVYEGDDNRLYDISRDTRHWFLFDRLDSLATDFDL